MADQSLWCSGTDRTRLRARLAEGEPTLSALLAACRAIADDGTTRRQPERDAGGQRVFTDFFAFVAACAVVHVLTGEVEAAERAAAAFLWATDPSDQDLPVALTLGTWALAGAVVADACREALDCSQAQQLDQRLVVLVEALRNIPPDTAAPVGDHWWAVRHGGACVAALAAHGRRHGDAEPLDLSEAIAWASGRVAACCKHLGDAGLCHEGMGYLLVSWVGVAPAILALRRRGICDLVARYPQLARSAASLWTAAIDRPGFTDDPLRPPPATTMLSWNNAGQDWWGVASLPCTMALAPAREQGALRTLYDRFHGIHARQPDWAGTWCGAYFSLVSYPFDSQPCDPEGVLPRRICDSRQGLWIARDRWDGPDACVVGVYARTTHVGGQAHEDAGSLRVSALGHHWAVGGGPDRRRHEWQTVCRPADGAGLEASLQQGLLTWDEEGNAGACCGLDLRAVSACRHERLVATRWPVDGVFALGLIDLIDDHLGRDWDWLWSFQPDLQVRLQPDGADLIASDGTLGQLRFLNTPPQAITCERMPVHERPLPSGVHRGLAGRPFLRCCFSAAPPQIRAVLTVSHRAVAIASGPGADLVIDAQPWPRPFGAAIPPDWHPVPQR